MKNYNTKIVKKYEKLLAYRYGKQIIITIVLLLIYIFYGFYVWINTQKTDNAYVNADISMVSSEIPGVISKIYIENNSTVEKGQLIAELDDIDYLAKYKISKYEKKSAKLQLKNLEHSIELAKIEIEKAKNQFNFTETEFKIFNTDLNRTKKLSKDNYTSAKNFDEIRLNFERSSNQKKQALLDLEKLKRSLESLQIDQKIAVKSYKKSCEQKKISSKDYRNTKIIAPVSGKIGNSNLQLGNYVRPGNILFALIPDNKIYIDANFKETQVKKFQSGMEVLIELDAYPSEAIYGLIDSVSPATGSKYSIMPSANATGNFTKIVQRIPVKISFEVPSHLKDKIIPGMSCSIKIRTDQN